MRVVREEEPARSLLTPCAWWGYEIITKSMVSAGEREGGLSEPVTNFGVGICRRLGRADFPYSDIGEGWSSGKTTVGCIGMDQSAQSLRLL